MQADLQALDSQVAQAFAKAGDDETRAHLVYARSRLRIVR